MGRDGFRMLKVWQKGKDLAVMIYGVTNRKTSDSGTRYDGRLYRFRAISLRGTNVTPTGTPSVASTLLRDLQPKCLPKQLPP